MLKILTDTSATFADREAVAQQLASLGPQRPLDARTAAAELCYGMDVCARNATATDLALDCPTGATTDENTTLGSPCFLQDFKQRYTCNTDVPAADFNSYRIQSAILGDQAQTYSSLVADQMMTTFAREYNLDLAEIRENPLAFEEFVAADPAGGERVKTIAQEIGALGQYTLECYQKINSILYSRDEAKLLRYFNLIKAVVNGLSVMPEYRQKVNRGAWMPEAVLAQYHQVGKVICSDGFTSTAVHDPARDEGDHPRNSFLDDKCIQRLYINFADDAPGCRSIDNASASKGENEVLLPPGSCFRVDKVYPRTDNSAADDISICSPLSRFNFELTVVPRPASAD